jgi:hypothetical protein
MNGEKRNLFVVSVDIKLLYERLLKAAIGDVITYEELSEIIRLDIRSKKGWSKLFSARRRAERHDRMLFSAVPTVGIQRCNDAEIVASGPKAVQKIRRSARRGAERLSLVSDFSTLSNTDKITHNTSAAHLGALYEFTKPSAARKIEAAVKESGQTLSLGATLEAFKGR